jgi:hypothetical protein
VNELHGNPVILKELLKPVPVPGSLNSHRNLILELPEEAKKRIGMILKSSPF